MDEAACTRRSSCALPEPPSLQRTGGEKLQTWQRAQVSFPLPSTTFSVYPLPMAEIKRVMSSTEAETRQRLLKTVKKEVGDPFLPSFLLPSLGGVHGRAVVPGRRVCSMDTAGRGWALEEQPSPRVASYRSLLGCYANPWEG